MAMITARQATPGTRLFVSGSALGIEGGVHVVHSLITVGEWVGHGNGLATLYSDKGQASGQYTYGHKFATTLAESIMLDDVQPVPHPPVHRVRGMDTEAAEAAQYTSG